MQTLLQIEGEQHLLHSTTLDISIGTLSQSIRMVTSPATICRGLGDISSGDTLRILIVDDHEAILNGTVPFLQRQYHKAEILTARTLNETKELLHRHHAIHLLILDLSIPTDTNEPAQRQVGLSFLKQFLSCGTGPNLMVLSTSIKPVFRFRSSVNAYEGGFALLDKREPIENMLRAADLALRGSIYWPQKEGHDCFFPAGCVELDTRWVNALKLKFHQGLTDKAIAKKMSVSDRTIRNYWVRLQDNLGISDDPDKDPRIEAWKVVYELGIVD
ncbi:MAG: response regulator transcription factor [Phormidesmis sp. RL_2_1]|nr:response regulator transcription factor [Phormidesmis sp. RL_2_1]